jgi:hypothetical protein
MRAVCPVSIWRTIRCDRPPSLTTKASRQSPGVERLLDAGLGIDQPDCAHRLVGCDVEALADISDGAAVEADLRIDHPLQIEQVAPFKQARRRLHRRGDRHRR